MSAYWASHWKCPDCGHQVTLTPGQDTRPIEAAHECDSRDLARHQERRADWEEGYRFALENHDDELVRADRERYGTGWIGVIRNGGIKLDYRPEEDR